MQSLVLDTKLFPIKQKHRVFFCYIFVNVYDLKYIIQAQRHVLSVNMAACKALPLKYAVTLRPNQYSLLNVYHLLNVLFVSVVGMATTSYQYTGLSKDLG